MRDNNYREAFINILEQATCFLNYIEQNIDALSGATKA